MTERSMMAGVDVGGTNVKIALVWSDGEVLASRQIPTQAESGPAAGCERIVSTLRQLMHEAGASIPPPRIVGVASAGLVDAVHNLVVDSPNLRSWERFPLAQRLGEGIGAAAYLENDVNAMAYGEWRFGAGQGTRHMVCLALGTGVGGGLILDGHLYRGARGAAAELGHITIDMHGPPCSCPNVGCLERHIGAGYISERARAALAASARPSRLRDLEDIKPETLFAAAEAGDIIAAEVLAESGALLGQGLVSLVNIFDPERVVIGGGVALAGDWLLEPARRVVRARAMSVAAAEVEIVPAALGHDGALIGAALLAAARDAGTA